MKKHIFFLSALVAATGLMTSCSNDDDMLSEVSSPTSMDANSIVFSTNDVTPSTRSAVTITNLSKFTVDAVTADKKNYFASVDFTFNGSKSVFESATPYYWPTDGSLSFFAISDPGTKSVNSDAVPTSLIKSFLESFTRRLKLPQAPISICKPEAGSKSLTLLSVPHLMPICVVRLIK